LERISSASGEFIIASVPGSPTKGGADFDPKDRSDGEIMGF
jgi:hypothetical protein